MARRRFFVPTVRHGMAELTGPDAEHLVRVLRAEAGQVYEITDNQNLYLAEIEVARKSIVSFRVLEQLAAPTPGIHLTLVAALFKFDRFEFLLEKATELGVTVLQPFVAARSEHGLAQAASKRSARWEKIALEASQQARRIHLPLVSPAVPFRTALLTEATTRFLLDENPKAISILQLLPQTRSPTDRVAVMLGPEGGFTDEEHAAARAAGWLPCSLGRTVLRAETAGLAALAVLQAVWNNSSGSEKIGDENLNITSV